MDVESLAEQLYNVMIAKMLELEPILHDDIEPWDKCKEEGKQLFRAMATYVLENMRVWTELY